MLRRYSLIVIVITFFSIGSLSAQTTGEWIGAELSLNLPHKFSFDVSGQARILNNYLNLYKYQAQFDLGYELHKRVDVGVSYRSEWRVEKDGYFYYRDKMFAEVKFNYPVNRFKFKDRIRYQRRRKTYINDDWDLIPIQRLRNKIELSYNIRKNKITPLVSFELFFPLNSFITPVVDEYRIAVDIKYPISKKQSIKTGILYSRELYFDTLYAILFRFTYTFKMKIK